MLEGIGGPIQVNKADLSGIDPTLDACCQREVESDRKRGALEATLRRHDRIALAERRRQFLRNDLSFGSGCSCCYDHTDGGEYPALSDLRLRLESISEEEKIVEEEEDRKVDGSHGNNGDSDSDSDSEFDYLLDEDPTPTTADDDQNDDLQISAVMAHQWDRMVDLQLAAMMKESALQHGFGVHRQHHPQGALQAAGLVKSGAALGKEAGTPAALLQQEVTIPAVVLHLFHPDSMLCASLDICLEKMSQSFSGTRFIRTDGTLMLSKNTNMSMLQRQVPQLKDASCALPALLAIKNGEVVAICRDIATLGHAREETIEQHAVEQFLWHAGVLLTSLPLEFEDYCRMQKEELEEKMKSSKRNKRFGRIRMNEENMQEEMNLYCCGIEGCNKSYRHEHVGVKNEEQSGLLVSEDNAIGDISST